MLKLTPSEIRYSQDSISCIFTGRHSGKKIGETLDELVDGDISVDDIPTISVVFRNRLWFAYDNRRLWVFKHFELLGGCTQISVIKRTYWDEAKYTTYNEGKSIRVRGDPGCTWYYKYTRSPEKYKNYLQHQNFNKYNESLKPGYADSFRLGLSISSHQSSLRLQPQNDWRYDTEGTRIKTNTDTSQCMYGSQQQQLFGYHRNEYADTLVSRSTSVTAKAMFNNSPSSFSHGDISSRSSSSRKETPSHIAHQTPSVASSYQNYYQSASERNLRDIRPILDLSSSDFSEHVTETESNPLPTDSSDAHPVYKSTPSAFTTGLRSIQSVFGRTTNLAATSEEPSVSSLYQRQYSLISERNLKYTPRASTLPSSNSTAARNNPIPGESVVTLPTERNRVSVTNSFESKSKSNLYSASSHPAQYREENKKVNPCRPLTTFRSSPPATETANVALPAQKAPPKLKPASRQSFVNIITVNQNQCNPKKPIMIMLDPSIIRYTKDTIEYPLSEERQSAVQRRLRELLQDENPSPMEIYKAYNLYWLKEENDVLWSLRKLMDQPSKWGRNTCKVKALVTEDNDAFLDFMRKEKPWLQISDILQLGQRIDISS